MSFNKRVKQQSFLAWGATALVGLLILVVLALFLRVSRGLLGVVLGGLAVLLILYWVRELRKTARKEWMNIPTPPSTKNSWDYELVEEATMFTVVAEVPGPESQVKATVNYATLEIIGGNSFRKTIKLKSPAEIQGTSYINGVLNIKLRRLDRMGRLQECNRY